MNRAGFQLDRFPLDTIDTLRQAGGVDLVGFYFTLASYQDGQAVDGRLIFETTSGAITTLGMSRERYYKLKGILESLSLYEVRSGRIYLQKAPAIRMPNRDVRNSDTSVRSSNAVMSLSQEEESTYLHDDGEGARTCLRPAGDSPELSTQSTSDQALWITQAIISEGQARDFARISRPQVEELARYLDELDPDLAVYAIEIMDGYGSRAWGPVLNQCRRWLENDIHTRQAAVEDHKARRNMLEAHQADHRNEAPMTARDYYAFVRHELVTGKTTVSKELARVKWTKPCVYAPSLTIKKRQELIRLAAWSVETGSPVAI